MAAVAQWIERGSSDSEARRKPVVAGSNPAGRSNYFRMFLEAKDLKKARSNYPLLEVGMIE